MDSRTGPRWSKHEDEILEELVTKHGTVSWDTIAYKLDKNFKHSPKMCENRWQQVIHLGLTKGVF